MLDLSFGRDGWDYQYIVRIRDNEEADKDMKNISAIKIAEMKINTVAVKERLAIGRFLYWDRRLILDRRTWTLCTGSRCTGGVVPVVDFNDGEVSVGWCYPGDADDDLRARQAVS
ncbi:MAG: hypothetical protein A2174_01070 [Candidatus Portnoybacteria bacterium RBG_13_41_18]|uniref:Uncharacterized protein n=1 Tax=Candidatus Portnoybacteria bacterium RBG_13_41_18 TaxID=1801991 RepID=A0A1G2F5F8_9BACT|nr:MAG: hypothetical protein A2174_01070 [Candidatus Portnoybacteria bacterium RBG_13_41_18]